MGRGWRRILTLWLLGTGLARAAGQAASPPSAISVWNLLQVLFGLGVVLIAVLLAAWVLKRLQPSSWGGQGPLRVLATLPVGARERVVLIKAGEEQLLIGVTANQINSLHVLSKTIDEDTLRAADPLPNFPEWLRQAMEKRGVMAQKARLPAWLHKLIKRD